MKKLVTAMLLMLLHIQVYAQTNQDAIVSFFEDYMDDSRFTNIYISARMFSLIATIPEGEDAEEYEDMLNNINGLRVLSGEEVNGSEMYKKAIKTLNLKGYEELMSIRGEDEDLKFLIKESKEKGVIYELLMLTAEEDSFFMLSLIGRIKLSQISKLSKGMDIEGLEELEKINDQRPRP